MMRRTLFPLTALLLTGCVNQSASYYIDGNEHTVTVRVEQPYFWKDVVNLSVTAARLPDCQRLMQLGSLPLNEASFELFAGPDNMYTLRAGKQMWRIETQDCTELEPPAEGEQGDKLGTFKLDADNKMVFEKAPDAPATAPAPASTAQ